MRLALSLLAAGAVLALAGCAASAPSGSASGGSVEVSRATWHYGEWPFTVDRGTLACVHPPTIGAVIFTASDGTAYAVNGTAMDNHYPDIRPIWRKAPQNAQSLPGLRVDIGGMIDRGLKLC